jgi:opacity protein-like surface antigen
MKNLYLRCPGFVRSAVAFAALILGTLGATTTAQADDVLGLYVGAAYGQAHIRAQLGGLIPGSTGSIPDFDQTHNAYQAMIGIRPISLLGAEIDYMDFGQQSVIGLGDQVPGLAGEAVTAEQASQKGEAAYALLYLPVPIIDVYVKGGLSRITTDATVTHTAPYLFCPAGSNCEVANVGSITSTSFAYGAGLQWKLGQWAVRGEYERFDAAGANPSLFSIGMTYWLQ